MIGSHDLRANIRRIGNDNVKPFGIRWRKQQRSSKHSPLFKDKLKKVFALQMKVHMWNRLGNPASGFAKRGLMRVKTKNVDGRICPGKQFL